MDNNFFEIENDQMFDSDIDKIRSFIDSISKDIFCHEIEKDKKKIRTHYRIPSTDNIRPKKINNSKYYYYFTNVFYEVIAGNSIIDAMNQYPDLFGIGNSEKVIEALNNVRPNYSSSNDDAIFSEEQYCFVLQENENGELNKNKVLKIELFRFQEEHKKNSNSKSNKEFVGGLMHAFQHFAHKDIGLSTFEKGYNLNFHPSYFIIYLTNALFNSDLIETKDKNGKKALLGVYKKINFYFFPVKLNDSIVFFLSTARYDS